MTSNKKKGQSGTGVGGQQPKTPADKSQGSTSTRTASSRSCCCCSSSSLVVVVTAVAALLYAMHVVSLDLGPRATTMMALMPIAKTVQLAASSAKNFNMSDAAMLAKARRSLRIKTNIVRAIYGEAFNEEDMFITNAHVNGVPVRIYAHAQSRDYLQANMAKLSASAGEDTYLALTEPTNVFVYIHGGGWVVGDLETHDYALRRLQRQYIDDTTTTADDGDDKAARHTIIVSVDYRLAPEHPYPAGLDDVVNVIESIAGGRNSPLISNHIIVGGDSAGGNLAIVSLLRAIKEGNKAITQSVVGQVLVYPATHTSCFSCYKSTALFGMGDFYLTMEGMVWFAQAYATREQLMTEALISPMMFYDQPDLIKQLPPAVLITADKDPLRDEGFAYGSLLKENGVPVAHVNYLNTVHGFFSVPLDHHEEAIRLVSEYLHKLNTQ